MLVGVTKGKAFAACVCGYTISEAYAGDIAAAMERIEAEAKANHRCSAAGAIKETPGCPSCATRDAFGHTADCTARSIRDDKGVA